MLVKGTSVAFQLFFLIPRLSGTEPHRELARKCLDINQFFRLSLSGNFSSVACLKRAINLINFNNFRGIKWIQMFLRFSFNWIIEKWIYCLLSLCRLINFFQLRHEKISMRSSISEWKILKENELLKSIFYGLESSYRVSSGL